MPHFHITFLFVPDSPIQMYHSSSITPVPLSVYCIGVANMLQLVLVQE